MTSANRGVASTGTVIGTYMPSAGQSRRLTRRAYVAVTCASGQATVTFPSQIIFDVQVTATASATVAPFTIPTVSSVTATQVKVVTVAANTAGNAIGGSDAVTVAADFA